MKSPQDGLPVPSGQRATVPGRNAPDRRCVRRRQKPPLRPFGKRRAQRRAETLPDAAVTGAAAAAEAAAAEAEHLPQNKRRL